ncbi:hypothetical protein K5I29_02475 [Flavobacterium agricola]|uniref:Ig-like domain-containing protein n=1 Tax=Flavobacterium agricola TaxID=2870839 RepID=A0ABY6M405_9FLAO|nr:hypothetical protein [Flavobacterium agricola]UYW01808.1 hypothetical protein K5I29_02475 [Flavobacterium agricola]
MSAIRNMILSQGKGGTALVITYQSRSYASLELGMSEMMEIYYRGDGPFLVTWYRNGVMVESRSGVSTFTTSFTARAEYMTSVSYRVEVIDLHGGRVSTNFIISNGDMDA